MLYELLQNSMRADAFVWLCLVPGATSCCSLVCSYGGPESMLAGSVHNATVLGDSASIRGCSHIPVPCVVLLLQLWSATEGQRTAHDAACHPYK
jgi:hypothetical protein